MKTENENQNQQKMTPRQAIMARTRNVDVPFPDQDHWFNLSGQLKTVTTTPTLAPKNVSDGVLIYVDDLDTPTTKRLYIYSRDANVWFYVALT